MSQESKHADGNDPDKDGFSPIIASGTWNHDDSSGIRIANRENVAVSDKDRLWLLYTQAVIESIAQCANDVTPVP